jgi:hypothetical protein
MTAEEFPLYGILDEQSASGLIRVEELRGLVSDYLQLPKYYPVLLDVLENLRGAKLDKKIDIQLVFRALEKADFITNIPDFYMNRLSKWTIKLIKAAIIVHMKNLLTVHEIREIAVIHHLKENEFFSVGVSCDTTTIYSMLWAINRTISVPVLNKWISMVSDVLEIKGSLMPHEFLYLVCNTHKKGECADKIFKVTMHSRMNANSKLFHIEEEFLKGYPQIKSMDARVQHMLNATYTPDKAIYEGIKLEHRVDKTQKPKKTSTLTNHSVPDEYKEYHKILKSSDLAIEIKKRLRGANTTINLAKTVLPEAERQQYLTRLNGKDILEEIDKEGYEDLNKPRTRQSSGSPTHGDNQLDAIRENTFYITAPKIRPKSSLPPKMINEIQEGFGMNPSQLHLRPRTQQTESLMKSSQSLSKLPFLMKNDQTNIHEETFKSLRLMSAKSPTGNRTLNLMSSVEFAKPKIRPESKYSSTMAASTTIENDAMSYIDNVLEQEFDMFEERGRMEDETNKTRRPPSTYFNSGNTQRKQVKIFSASSRASKATLY